MNNIRSTYITSRHSTCYQVIFTLLVAHFGLVFSAETTEHAIFYLKKKEASNHFQQGTVLFR